MSTTTRPLEGPSGKKQSGRRQSGKGAAGETTPPDANAPAQHQPTAKSRQRQRWLAWIFLAPTILGMGLFTLVPIVASVVLAFFRWDIISAPTFVGFDN